jgi:hypothetical protein
MFKPGSGQFDIIYDVDEKNNQTMKSRFHYLEKLPLRKFKTNKHVLGCSITEQENCAIIVELEDINNNLCREEIEARTEPVVGEYRNKYVFAYLIDPNQTLERHELSREDARKRKIRIPDMDERDEVVRIEKLFVDLGRREMFFQVVLREQHSVTIVKVDFKYPFVPQILIGQQQIVREAIPRGDIEYLGEAPMESQPTELQHYFYDEL